MKLCRILFILLILACEGSKAPPVDADFVFQDNPENTLWDYSLLVSQNGLRNYKLWTERAENFPTKKLFLCYDSLIVTFYKKNENVESHFIHAVNGEWTQATNNFTAIKDVVVINEDGDRLETDTLYYDYTKDLIYSNSDVVFYTNLDTLYGKKFESNSDLSNIIIFKVTGRSYRE